MDNAPRVLAARYEVGELIGRGGMAEVHIGRDTRLGRTVAIKILRSDLARDPSFLARFRREAQSAAALNHPAIVAVYDTGEDVHTDAQGASVHVPFIVMEYVEGHTVRDIVRDGHSVPIEEAVEITAGVLAALEYSHHAGIVHRDIKPANVMITPTGAVKVMDFGIARAMADSAATMTQTHAVIGTAQYLSPEQARGETVDARSDLYSTGCLLFEMLTGRPPFQGDSPVAVAYQHVRETPLKPSDIAPDVPEVLDRITLKSLAKERSDRYSSAGEFRADLESAARGGAISAGPIAMVAAAASAAGLAGAAAATQYMPPAGDATQVMQPATPPSPWGTATQSAVGATGTQPVAVEEEPEEEKSRKGLMWTLIAIGVVAIAAIVTIILMMGQDDSPELFPVPTIAADATPESAKKQIEDADFVFEQVDKASDEPEGTFLEQDPAGGTELAHGKTVTAYFSTGPDSTTVPDVSGLSQNDARAKLEDAGLKVGSVDTENHKSIGKDDVIRTDPPAGDAVKAGETINLVTSTGKVTLPDVTGMSKDEADAALADIGLRATFTETETAQYAAGTVFEQSPSPGEVEQEITVDLKVAKEPAAETTQVPNVAGMTVEQATEALAQESLNAGSSSTEQSTQYAAGIVIRTDPAAGSSVQIGPDTKINFVVSSGPGPQTSDPAQPTEDPGNSGGDGGGNGDGGGDDGGGQG
ncbi:serine/threonine-protein kinase [Sediminihabitans luteus]|uniref:non-specific serine/threonine protein kinase n=1 Tax=Sediminihabitans luteus TaxID=1138585 RepID=A0A2M9CCQ3_9CELL|nr:Stk1 family PASTA domain-containing Ser/Thr kinase [Sediminihabitans luteus]PJJ69165.1 serine/threonine-protein kinase [Sediminihabitans luteus]